MVDTMPKPDLNYCPAAVALGIVGAPLNMTLRQCLHTAEAAVYNQADRLCAPVRPYEGSDYKTRRKAAHARALDALCSHYEVSLHALLEAAEAFTNGAVEAQRLLDSGEDVDRVRVLSAEGTALWERMRAVAYQRLFDGAEETPVTFGGGEA